MILSLITPYFVFSTLSTLDQFKPYCQSSSTNHKIPSTKFSSLWKYSPHPRRFRDATDGQNISSSTHVRTVAQRRLMYLVKRVAHCVLKRLIDALLAPEKRILILNPFVITNSHPARIREDVRNQQDAVFFKHTIRARCCRPV